MMNRMLISLAAAGAMLLGNASYAITDTPLPASAKGAAAVTTPAVKPINASAETTLAAPAAKAVTCRDTKGKFIKCAAAPKKAAACRDTKGKFIKCGK